MYTINIRTLQIHFDMLSFKQSKNNFHKRSSLESVLLPNTKWDTFIPSKVIISFVELSVLYYLRTCSQNVQVTSKLSPQSHFITKHFFLNNSSIIVIR